MSPVTEQVPTLCPFMGCATEGNGTGLATTVGVVTGGGVTSGSETDGGETVGGETVGGKTVGGETVGGETVGGETCVVETIGAETVAEGTEEAPNVSGGLRALRTTNTTHDRRNLCRGNEAD